MMLNCLKIGSMIVLSFFLMLGNGFTQGSHQTFEEIINDYLGAYDLTPDNLFRLAAYTEMKGKYSGEFNTLTLDFGDLGQLAFYEKNLLLRTESNRVYHMDKDRDSEALAKIMNRNLSSLFEKIILLSNHNADPELIKFVDKSLSKKNIEPFDKIFLRHILIKYGKYDRRYNRVEFHTDWLPSGSYVYHDMKTRRTVKKPIEPLKLKLDENVVRGYYLWSGGTVYVEDVDRDVKYATGEDYSYNVAAFKLMIQKLFVQTTTFVVASEKARIKYSTDGRNAITDIHLNRPVDTYVVVTPSDQGYSRGSSRGSSRGAGNSQQPRPGMTYLRPPSSKEQPARQNPKMPKVRQLYSPNNWIPMMLGILRANGVNIGDEDVIKYFVNQPYFPRIYDQLTREEKAKVDRYRRR